MESRTLDRAMPFVYALAILVCVLFAKSAVAPVAVLGAVLVGAYYAVLRPRLLEVARAREAERARQAAASAEASESRPAPPTE